MIDVRALESVAAQEPGDDVWQALAGEVWQVAREVQIAVLGA